MKTIRILVSSVSHMPLWTVWRDSGIAADHGIELDLDIARWPRDGRPAVPMGKRAELLLDGTYQFLSGLHHEPYSYRARGDKRFVYLAQAQNDWDDRLIVGPDVTDLRQLEGGSVVVSQAPCVVGNLKEALRIAGVDVGKVSFAENERPRTESFGWMVDAVADGEVRGAVVDLPYDQIAVRRGLTTLDLPPVPVIHNVTICSTTDWVRENADLVRAFLTSMVVAVHFFKTEPEAAERLLREGLAPMTGLTDDADIAYLRRAWAGLLNAKPYPHPLAIWNVYRLDVAGNPEFNIVDPLEPWDLGILRDIDNSGFIDRLYGGPVRNPAVTPLI